MKDTEKIESVVDIISLYVYQFLTHNVDHLHVQDIMDVTLLMVVVVMLKEILRVWDVPVVIVIVKL